MKNVLIALAAILLASCTSTGGAPLNVEGVTNGRFEIATDGNTVVMQGHGDAQLEVRNYLAGADIYPVIFPTLRVDGEGRWVFILDFNGERYWKRFDWGVPLPGEIEPHIRSVLSPIDIVDWQITFAPLEPEDGGTP